MSDLPVWSTTQAARSAILSANLLGDSEWTLAAAEDETAFLARLRAMPTKLEDVTTRIFQGLKTSADDIFIVDELERRERRVRVYSHETEAEHWLESDLLHPLIKGGDSRRYALADPHRGILFPYAENDSGEMELSEKEILEKDYPLTWHYLLANRARLETREDGKMSGKNWYGYVYPKALDVISQPKIFTPDLALRAAYSVDETGAKFFTGGLAGGYDILVRAGIDRDYVLALLNSRLLDWFVAKNGTTMRGGWHSYEARFIRSAPIFAPRGKSQKARCAEISSQAGSLRKLASQRQHFVPLLREKLPHQHRTPCSLGHYLQLDYASAIAPEILIDDVMRKGFLHGSGIETDNGALVLSAQVSATAKGEAGTIPILRLRCVHAPLRQFVYAC